jgi:hypothetical protein
MKKHILGFFLMFILAIPVRTQSNDRWMALAISPLPIIVGNLNINYQIKINDDLAITVPVKFGYSWYVRSFFATAFEDRTIKNTVAPIILSVGGGVKFLLAASGFNDSFYLGPRLSLSYEQSGVFGQKMLLEKKIWTLTPMAFLGWDWFYESGFYMSLGGGLGIDLAISKKIIAPRQINPRFKSFFKLDKKKIGLAWDLEFKLGYSW